MKQMDELSAEGIVFNEKPDAVPYNYRISYRVSLLCLILKLCGGRKGCSLMKIHIISTAIASKDFYDKLQKFIKFNRDRDIIVRFDPAINRALEYAIADKLIGQQVNGRYKLVEKGKTLVDNICEDNGLLKLEKELLNGISLNLTEERINEISERWGITNV